MNDPIVDEVRRHRMEHTRKFGGDLKLICEDLRSHSTRIRLASRSSTAEIAVAGQGIPRWAERLTPKPEQQADVSRIPAPFH